jgi:hypothetical protein
MAINAFATARRRHAGFMSSLACIAPVTDSTLALLVTNKIPYHTQIQGRDFGSGLPTRGGLFLWISVLSTVWICLLCRVIKRPGRIFGLFTSSNRASLLRRSAGALGPHSAIRFAFGHLQGLRAPSRSVCPPRRRMPWAED